jgi:RNA polymerase sigma-70 factor (ECF subfamily)
MASPDKPLAARDFDDVVLPHLDAARRLARWLTHNEQDAEDVVQEASLRAFRYFRTFTGGNARAWFLKIVRNLCYARRHRVDVTDSFDEEQHWSDWSERTPEARVLHFDNARLIERAMSTLPRRSRELLVLRELEGLSYRELSDEMHMPIGTVMSGLSRARRALRDALQEQMQRGTATRLAVHTRQTDAVHLNRPHQPDAGLSERTEVWK